MRVGFVLLDAQITGGQVVAEALMLGLMESGHHAVAVFPSGGPMVERLRSAGVEVRIVPLSRSYRLGEAAGLGRVVKAAGVELVDAHTLYVGNQLAAVACRLVRLPLVVHSHIDERYHGSPVIAAAQRAAGRVARPRATTFVAVSSYLRDLLLAQGVDPGRVVVIHNGVRLGERIAPSERPGLRVVCAARLAQVKGQAILLEALHRADPRISVDFVGEDLEQGGAYRTQLQRRAADLGLAARVRFLGIRSDLPDLIRAADALVLPSFAEGFPLVALEAMAEARAVIATSVGGTPEAVLDGETGLLVSPGDPDGLAGALDRLSADPDLRASMGDAGYARVARLFTTERMVSRTLVFYEDVLGGARRPLEPW